MDKLQKTAIVQKAIELLSEKVRLLEQSLKGTNTAINDAPGAMQSHSDTTRSQLTSVMSVAQKAFQEKVDELHALKMFSEKNLSLIDSRESKVGVIIAIEKENNLIENYFLLPGGSGLKLEYGGKKIICLTIVSPLGKALLGRTKGESFLLTVGLKPQNVKIVELV